MTMQTVLRTFQSHQNQIIMFLHTTFVKQEYVYYGDSRRIQAAHQPVTEEPATSSAAVTSTYHHHHHRHRGKSKVSQAQSSSLAQCSAI